jgi:hypothetical protein
MGNTSLDHLYDMQARDPDGGSIEPTEQDYRLFEEWAVATYGRAAFERYQGGSWAPEPEV